MQKRAADTSGSLCVACSTDLQERVIFLWGPLKFSIFGESGGTSRPMSPATFFATLLPNARVSLLLAKRNARFCFNFKGPLTRWGEILVFRSFHSHSFSTFVCHLPIKYCALRLHFAGAIPLYGRAPRTHS